MEKETDTMVTIRQFYAFVVNGVSCHKWGKL